MYLKYTNERYKYKIVPYGQWQAATQYSLDVRHSNIPNNKTLSLTVYNRSIRAVDTKNTRKDW